jgi:hypothetical protein
MRHRIDKIGIEIEGEYSEKLSHLLNKRGIMKGDGSINCCYECYEKKLHAEEYNSKPYTSMRTFGALFKLLNKYAQRGEFHWNTSMGLHIHMSFNKKFPTELFSIQFINYFHKRMAKQFPEAWALRHDNHFCSTDIRERDIYRNTSDRYKSVNLLPALNRHGTIEFRIWPSDSPVMMYKYLKFTVKTVKLFLKRTIRVREQAELPDIFTPEVMEFTQNIDLTPEIKL